MRGPSMKSLQERLSAIQLEIDKLEAQKALINDMIREAKGEPKAKPRAPRSNVKKTVLELLEKVGEDGLNAVIAVEMAENAGVHLERGSVSSILSRLKNDAVITYDGERYRLLGRPSGPDNIHPLRTSGAAM